MDTIICLLFVRLEGVCRRVRGQVLRPRWKFSAFVVIFFAEPSPLLLLCCYDRMMMVTARLFRFLVIVSRVFFLSLTLIPQPSFLPLGSVDRPMPQPTTGRLDPRRLQEKKMRGLPRVAPCFGLDQPTKQDLVRGYICHAEWTRNR